MGPTALVIRQDFLMDVQTLNSLRGLKTTDVYSAHVIVRMDMKSENRRRAKELIKPVLFLGGLFVFGYYNDAFYSFTKDPLDTLRPEVEKKHTTQFEESAEKLGIVGDYSALNDAGLMEYPYRASAGIAVADINRDGRQDIISTNWSGGAGLYVYLQNKKGTFDDVSSRWIGDFAQLENKKEHVASTVLFDFNNDFWIDMVVLRTGCISIYKNEKGKAFRNVTKEMLKTPVCAGFSGANFADINGDGYLDLYLHMVSTNYTNAEGSGFNGLGGIYNPLLINERGQAFSDQTRAYGVENRRVTWGSVFYQGTQGNRLVMLVINDFANNRAFFKSIDGEKFRRITDPPLDLVRGHMGGDVVYLDGEQSSSVYVTNATRVGYSHGFNLLLNWDSIRKSFSNKAHDLRVADCGFGWGAKFGDFDNDGLGDIFSANGYWNFGSSPYWYPYLTYGQGSLHLRGKYQSQTSMPSTQGTVLAGEQKNCLFMQATGAVFQDEAGLSGVNDLENGRGVALADLNEDGRLEVLVANIHHAPSIYINNTDSRSEWVGFQFESHNHNSYGVGTAIILMTDKGPMRRDLFPGNGFAGVSEPRIHFGLGGRVVKWAKILLPDGRYENLRDWKMNAYNIIKN